MKMSYTTVSLAMVALLLGCAAAALAQTPAATPAGVTFPPASVAHPGDAGQKSHAFLQILGKGSPMTGKLQAYGPPYSGYFYETPASIACVYSLGLPNWTTLSGCNPNVVPPSNNPTGGSKAIAIVDAYDYPAAAADLQAFSNQFGVPFNSSYFQVVYAPFGSNCTGTGPQPASAVPYGWDIEEALDIEWAHAMAPYATLYLVEAQSSSNSDLDCAVKIASGLVAAAGGGEVSMSWGSDEYSSQVLEDSIFTTPKVVYFASSGDGGSVSYPSSSPNVVSVGGTAISRNITTGKYQSEIAWQDAGAGLSRFEPVPAYQSSVPSVAAIVGTHRGTPDIASDADPFTGVWVYDSLQVPGYPWWVVGGTSVSSPTWAGIVNAAGHFAASTKVELNNIYNSAPFGESDIISGNCGAYASLSAGTGFDLCTGNGSPYTYLHK
jgi:kumamolisin